MNKTLKLLSLFLVLTSILACDISEEETIPPGELEVKYTYIKEVEAGKVTFINTSANADSFLWEFGDGTTSTVKDPVKTFTETGEYLVKLTASNNKTGNSDSYSSIVSVFVFQGGLVNNGNFESGTTPWTFGVANAIAPALLVTEDGNTYFSINVAAAGNPFDVNLSQIGISMTQGTTYRLTFDAWSNVNRSMVVGIGLSGAPWTNQSVAQNLTTAVQSYSVDLVANFTNANSRVIFDMGAAVGRVNIDNVTLTVVP
jgi:PKD repeat protein